jgi:hypothetical protein
LAEFLGFACGLRLSGPCVTGGGGEQGSCGSAHRFHGDWEIVMTVTINTNFAENSVSYNFSLQECIIYA